MIAPRRSGPALAVKDVAISQAFRAAFFPTPRKDTFDAPLNAPLKPLGIRAT